MGRWLILLLGLLGPVVALNAQGLQVVMVTEYREYLPNEPLNVRLSIKNISGEPVILGQDKDWIKFTIFDLDLKPVHHRGSVPAGEVFVVDDKNSVDKYFNIGPFFNLSDAGRYSIQAHIKVRRWKETISASAPAVRVVRGVSIMTLRQGIPDLINKSKKPEIRAYTLIRKRNQGRTHLYVRVEEEKGKAVYNVQPLGGIVSFAKPEFHLDQSRYAHAIFQNGSRSYLYCVIDSDGEMSKRQTYEIYRQVRPTFSLDDRGDIVVRGGRRVTSDSDIPRQLKRPRSIRKLPPRPSKPKP